MGEKGEGNERTGKERGRKEGVEMRRGEKGEEGEEEKKGRKGGERGGDYERLCEKRDAGSGAFGVRSTGVQCGCELLGVARELDVDVGVDAARSVQVPEWDDSEFGEFVGVSSGTDAGVAGEAGAGSEAAKAIDGDRFAVREHVDGDVLGRREVDIIYGVNLAAVRDGTISGDNSVRVVELVEAVGSGDADVQQ